MLNSNYIDNSYLKESFQDRLCKEWLIWVNEMNLNVNITDTSICLLDMDVETNKSRDPCMYACVHMSVYVTIPFWVHKDPHTIVTLTMIQ